MKPPNKAPAFAFLYPHLADIARSMGYSLAIHGTMDRDLDLIACPWTEDAVAPILLVQAIGAYVDVFTPTSFDGPEDKPCGRKAWLINMDGGVQIDISVMPIGPRPDPIEDVSITRLKAALVDLQAKHDVIESTLESWHAAAVQKCTERNEARRHLAAVVEALEDVLESFVADDEEQFKAKSNARQLLNSLKK